MPTYEHAISIGSWFLKSLVESSKLRQMTFSEEAAHRNKANARYQIETRWTSDAPEDYAAFDEPHVLILQGVATVADEAVSTPDSVHVNVPYPIGFALAPFIRRPIPVVHGFCGVMDPYPPVPTLENLSYRNIDFAEMADRDAFSTFSASPEASVGVSVGTDFLVSLVIAHRWPNNFSGIGDVHPGGFLFWRTIGHVAAY